MDAPKCQNFPSCGKHHYGECGSDQGKVPAEVEVARKRVGRTKSGSVRSIDKAAGVTAEGMIIELEARLESVELRLEKLESRKRYMRDYQRSRRAREREGLDD